MKQVTDKMKHIDKYEKVSELARRRGFFWPSNEIYGGTRGFINWGPLGSVLKRKIEDRFREIFLQKLGLYELESPIITPEIVFKASGHIQSFKEPMVECNKCNRKFRADQLFQENGKLKDQNTDEMTSNEIEDLINKNEIRCPECKGTFSHLKSFLTMFKTTIGPSSESVGYGRPEAAQGIFVEFKRLYEQSRQKLPIGFATIGHALRNEISPRQGPIRLREFTIIDLEFFIDPKNPECPLIGEIAKENIRLVLIEDQQKGLGKPIDISVKNALSEGHIKMQWLAFFMVLAKRFLVDLGVPEEKQRFIEKSEWERAHYSIEGFDQEIYLDRWGWVEVSGFNYRTDYDLKRHMEESRVDMRIFKKGKDKAQKTETIIKPIISKIGPLFKKETQKVIDLLLNNDPKDIVTSLNKNGFYKAGKYKVLKEHIKIIQKTTNITGYHFIPHVIEPSFGSDRLAYTAMEYAYKTRKGRVILTLPRNIAPIQLAILPLVKKNGLPERAIELKNKLIIKGFIVEYDDTGSIGRRYARFDEIGTPLCITVDYQTLKDDTVTIRDLLSWKQIRINIKDLSNNLFEYFKFEKDFKDLGFSMKSSK
jgi:glycyl-tRNA synthetase